MTDTNALIRIGRIDFANVWPVFYYFSPKPLNCRVELIPQVPTKLNKALSSGWLDIAPISSFSYAENFEQYLLFPNLSVSTFGQVKSILLFHKQPLERLRFGKFALTTSSATSVNLLKIIMSKFLGGNPEYVQSEPRLNEMMKEADAALLIGDDAIKAGWENSGFRVTDLGELWAELTGTWMSYAVWAVRKDTFLQNPEAVESIYHAFIQSKQKGLQNLSEIIDELRARIGGTSAYWLKYFTQLNYDFGDLQMHGLKLYYHYAKELGLLREDVSLNIWSSLKVNG